MLAKLEQHRSPLTAAEARRNRHLLIVLPKVEKPAELKGIPHVDALERALERRKKTVSDLRKSPVTTDLPHGALVSWIVDDPERPIFEQVLEIMKEKGFPFELYSRCREILDE